MAKHSSVSNAPSAQDGIKHFSDADSADRDTVDLKKYFYTLWVERWKILGAVGAGALLALIVAFLQTPLYEANGTMMIKQTQQNSSLMNMLGGNNALSGLVGSTFGVGGGVNIANEQEVLESRKFFNAMADDLMEDPIMENGRMYPVLWEEWPEDSVMVDQRTVAARLANTIVYELLTGTTIIEFFYASPSPLEAKHMVNLAMQTYREISKEQNIKLAGTATDFLDVEEAEIQDSLYQAEQELEQFMDSNEIAELEAQTTNLINQIAELRRKRYEAQAELQAANASITEYEKRLDELRPGLSDKLASAIGTSIEKLQAKISELKAEKALIYSRQPSLQNSETQPKHIQNINQQIEELQERVEAETDSLIASNEEFIGFLGQGRANGVINTLAEYSQKLIELRVERLQYQAQVDFLTEQINEQEQFLERVPENAVELARLKRDVKVQEELYLAVTQQRAQMAMSAQAELGNSRPLDRAILPQKPTYPNYLLFLLIGMFTTGFLALGYITLNSVMSDTIRSTDDIRSINIPLLGVIPFAKSLDSGKGSKRFISSDDQSFHKLASRILHHAQASTAQALSVTSSFEGEGKTTVAAGLAMALAYKGKEVIIVETNRSGLGIGSVFGNAKEKGLAGLLEQKLPVDDVISTADLENLHYITAGASPMGNLDHVNFKDLMAELRKRYDYIIFDTPALRVRPDAIDLSGITDGSLIVSEFGKTKTSDVEYARNQLRGVDEAVLGVVLNKYKVDKARERDLY